LSPTKKKSKNQKKMKVYSAVVLFLLQQLVFSIHGINADENGVPFTDKCYIFNSKEAVCDRFQEWSEVNTFLSDLLPTPQTYRVNIKPQTPIVLTDQLNAGSLWRVYNGGSSQYITINIIEINGIEIFLWKNTELPNSAFNSSQNALLAFEQSLLIFYSKNRAVSDQKCSSDLLSESSTENVNSLFNSFSSIRSKEQVSNSARLSVHFYKCEFNINWFF
jgi:hypothetical protein